jgi:hypothetical protein
MLTINNIKPSQVEDSWICVIGSDVEFTVKNGYVFLSENFLPHTNLQDSECRILKCAWESLAPMKVKVFSWQLMLQRLPTRVNLARRGVFTSPIQAQCGWCSSEVESDTHLFTKCDVAVEVWLGTHSWLGIITAVPWNISHSFESFVVPFKSKKRREGLNLIWQTVMWSLWLARNSLIF